MSVSPATDCILAVAFAVPLAIVSLSSTPMTPCASFVVRGLLLLAAVVPSAAGSASDIPDEKATAVGRAYLEYQAKVRALQPPPESDDWWRKAVHLPQTAEVREKLADATLELHTALRALGVEPATGGSEQRLSFLAPAKQDAVTNIEAKYHARVNELRTSSGYMRIPGDAERMREFAAERDRAFAAVLTPEEREQLDLRGSSTAIGLRQRYAELIHDEAQYRKIFAVQKAFDEKYSEAEIGFIRTADAARARSEAEKNLVAEIGAIIGDEAKVRLAHDTDYQAMKTLCRRFNLPDSALDGLLKLRENYATQSLTINAEAGMSPMDRRSLIQDLAKDARKELVELVGKDPADAYAMRSTWLQRLENGSAYSLNPKDSPPGMIGSLSTGIYYVSPGGVSLTPSSSPVITNPSGSGTTRRVLIEPSNRPPAKDGDKKTEPAPAVPVK